MGRLFLFDVVALDLGEAEQLEDAQGLVVVLVGQVEVEADLLDDGDLVRLDKFDEGSVGVFHVGEMSVGLAHAEVGAAIAHEGMSQGLGLSLHGVHVAYVEAEVDESRIAPEAAFEQLLAGGLRLDQLQV